MDSQNSLIIAVIGGTVVVACSIYNLFTKQQVKELNLDIEEKKVELLERFRG